MDVEKLYASDGSLNRILVNNIRAYDIEEAYTKALNACTLEMNKGFTKLLPKFLQKELPPFEMTFNGVSLVVSTNTTSEELKEQFIKGKKELVVRQQQEIVEFDQKINECCTKKDPEAALKMIYAKTKHIFEDGIQNVDASITSKYIDVLSSKKEQISNLLDERTRQKFISELDTIVENISKRNDVKLADASKRIALLNKNISMDSNTKVFDSAIVDLADTCTYTNIGNIGKERKEMHTKFVYNISKCVTEILNTNDETQKNSMSSKLRTLLTNSGFSESDTKDTVDISKRSGAMRSTLGQLIRDLREGNYEYVSYAPDVLKRASYLDTEVHNKTPDSSLEDHIKNSQNAKNNTIVITQHQTLGLDNN